MADEACPRSKSHRCAAEEGAVRLLDTRLLASAVPQSLPWRRFADDRALAAALRRALADQVRTRCGLEPDRTRPLDRFPAALRASHLHKHTSGPRGTRTHNPRIKSPLLCQLS